MTWVLGKEWGSHAQVGTAALCCPGSPGFLPAEHAPWRLGVGLGACGCPKGSHMRFAVCRESVLEGG